VYCKYSQVSSGYGKNDNSVTFSEAGTAYKLPRCGLTPGIPRMEERTIKKGYWVIVARSISDESAFKAYAPISGGGGPVIWRALFDSCHKQG
jgi:hypothetical protein